MARISIDVGAVATQPVITFSDINFEMAALGEADLLYDATAIAKSVMTILSTYRGQRLFQPTFGANLEMLLFEPVDSTTADDIKRMLLESLVYETDITLTNGGVVVQALLDLEAYMVKISYAIPALEQEATLSFNLARRN